MALRFGSGKKRRDGDAALSSDDKKGTGCTVLFGLIFGCAGLAAAFFLGKMFVENLDTYQWNKTPCELLSCEVKVEQSNQESPFSIDVRYRYRVDGANYEGTRLKLDGGDSDDYTKLARKRERMLNAADGKIVAYVDPDHPSSAILERGNLWLLSLTLLFPLPFLGIGFGMVYFALFKKSKKDALSSQASYSSSADKSGRTGHVVGLVIFTVLLLAGVGLSFPLAIDPNTKSVAAKGWPETPCKILWSRVQRHEGEDSDTYSVDIFYQYQVEGKTYRSNRYGFFSGSSSGRNSKQAITALYPRGSTQTCYVNPDDPLEAVLKRELGVAVLLGLIPLIMLLIGISGLSYTLKKTAKVQTRGARSASHIDTGADNPRAAIEFQPGKKRLLGFFGALFVALFWNGIVSVFVWQVVESFRHGSPEWFLTLFMIPFVLVGIVMIGAVVYTVMMQFTPKPIVTVSPGSPLLGEELRVSWRLRGGGGRLKNLRLTLSGIEKATYRQGTNTRTDSETFYRRVIVEAQQGIDLIQGEGRITVPLDLCSSIDLGNNEIEWSVKVEGEIPISPDINDRYVIKVRPNT